MSLTPPRELPVGWEDAIPAQAGTASGLLIYLPALLAALCVVPFWLQRSKASAPESDSSVAPAESSSLLSKSRADLVVLCCGRRARVARAAPSASASHGCGRAGAALVGHRRRGRRAVRDGAGRGAGARGGCRRRRLASLAAARRSRSSCSAPAPSRRPAPPPSGGVRQLPAGSGARPRRGVDLERLVAEGAVLDYLAVHAEGERAALGARWLRRAFLSAPPLVRDRWYTPERRWRCTLRLDFYTWLLARSRWRRRPSSSRAAFGPDNLLMPRTRSRSSWRPRASSSCGAAASRRWARSGRGRGCRGERSGRCTRGGTTRGVAEGARRRPQGATTQTTVALGLCVIIAASQLLLLKEGSKDLGRSASVSAPRSTARSSA